MLVVMPVIPASNRGFALVLVQHPVVGRNIGKAVEFLRSRVLDAHVQFQNIVEELAWELAFLEALLRLKVCVI